MIPAVVVLLGLLTVAGQLVVLFTVGLGPGPRLSSTIASVEEPLLGGVCSHCQADVPGLVSLLKAGGLPAGVEMYSVSTAVRAHRPNYPPSTWLEREQWRVPVIADDRSGAAAEAAGLSGFPFFVFVRAGATVAGRHEGELGIDELKDRIARLTRPSAARAPAPVRPDDLRLVARARG